MKKTIEGQILKIFPTEIFTFKCYDQHLIENTLENLKEEDWKNIKDSNRCHQTASNRLDQKTEYKRLYNWFDVCLGGVLKYLKFNCDNLQITLSWANKAFESESLFEHKHPNSFISGVFYLTDTNSRTIFRTYRDWSNFDGTSYLNFNPVSDSNQYYFHKPEKGQLLIFPSNLSHSVETNKEKDERFSISFNAFPSGKIGDFGALTGLHITIK